MLAKIAAKSSRNSLIISDALPFTCLSAISLDLSVLAFIKSIIPSASVKSILPFKKALLVNSPGSAKRQPCDNKTSNILLVVLIPP